MRFIKKLLVTGGVAAALITGAVVAPATASASPFVGHWDPYFSADHKAEAEGKYVLDHEKKKVWYWEKFKKPIKKCWWKHGEKKCKIVGWKWDKKWSWKWEEYTKISVKGELTNHKWWGDKKYKCAWAVFKIVRSSTATPTSRSSRTATRAASGSGSTGDGREHDRRAGLPAVTTSARRASTAPGPRSTRLPELLKPPNR